MKKEEADLEIVKLGNKKDIIKDIINLIKVTILGCIIYKIFEVTTKNLAGKLTTANIKMDLFSGFLQIVLENKNFGFFISVLLNVALIIMIFIMNLYYRKKLFKIIEENRIYKNLLDPYRNSSGLNKKGK